jgi:hypothetical protein
MVLAKKVCRAGLTVPAAVSRRSIEPTALNRQTTSAVEWSLCGHSGQTGTPNLMSSAANDPKRTLRHPRFVNAIGHHLLRAVSRKKDAHAVFGVTTQRDRTRNPAIAE